MSTIVAELYDALRTAGVPDDKARAAAAAVIGADTQNGFATKADLGAVRNEIAALRGEIGEVRATMATKAELFQLEARLIRWNVGTIIAMTAVFAAVVKLV
jgi:type II secretory pathway component PulK